MYTPASPTPPTPKPSRCNADYRWTLPKIVAFLDALAACGRVAEAAAAVGMSRQSAYRFKARLAGTRHAGAFEGARRQGLKARAAASLAASRAASQARAASRWAGPTLSDYLAVQDDSRSGQGDASGRQGDAGPSQGNAGPAQGDGGPPQGDANPHKVTGFALGRGPGGPAGGPCASADNLLPCARPAGESGASLGGEGECCR